MKQSWESSFWSLKFQHILISLSVKATEWDRMLFGLKVPLSHADTLCISFVCFHLNMGARLPSLEHARKVINLRFHTENNQSA